MSLLTAINTLLNIKLKEAPQRPNKPFAGLMPYKANTPKYVMENDKLIGLNLANTGLTDELWQQLRELDGFDPKAIQALNLSDNQLREFRLDGMDNLKLLNLEDNPLETPPEEVLKQGREAVLRYLRELESQGEEEIYEVKLLILGEGEAGKTTLWNKIQNIDYPVPLPPDQQPSTVGIEIKEGWKFEHLEQVGTQFLVNLWDFGGQEIQHMTHQFFLTRRSFYVLLADGRREGGNFAYWFKIVDLLGTDPDRQKEPLPVLVVMNTKGVATPKLPYDPSEVANAFPNMRVFMLEVDFAKKDFRLKGLMEAIKDTLCTSMEHLPLTFPRLWNQVREELYQLREQHDHIRYERFEEICRKHGIEDEEQIRLLSRTLHDLGVILHHEGDIRLEHIMVLKPMWVVKGIYEIMHHKQVKENQGRFDDGLLKKAWSKKGYSTEEQIFLMGLMQKDSFEVCFQAEELGKTIYIAPTLLPEVRPDFEWKEDQQALRYIFQYPFMPKGLIGRLIVRLHELIQSQEDKKVVWEKGMLLRKASSEALVVEATDAASGGKIIQIEVIGPDLEDRRFLLRNIRDELNKIHRDSFPNLTFQELIPCPCPGPCEARKNGKQPSLFSLSMLQSYLDDDLSTIPCLVGRKNISIAQLMSGVQEGERMREKPKIHPVKELILENSLDDALRKLLFASEGKVQNKVIQLMQSLEVLKTQELQKTISVENAQLERNRIVQAALALCDGLGFA